MKKITLLLLILTASFSFGQVLSEDFDAGLTIPAGWTNNELSLSGEVWIIENTGEAIGYNDPNSIYYDDGLLTNNYAVFDSDGYGGGTSAENTALESPVFDATTISGPVQLSFNHFFTAGYGGFGYVEVYDGTSWIEVASYTGASQTDSSFGLVEIDVTTELAAATNAQVRFRWVGDYSWGWAVDNVVVDEGPSCLVPTDFTAGAVTTTSFEVTWTDTNTGTPNWEIEWGATGFTQGGGTSVTGLTTPAYTFPGLSPDTTYDFYIRTNCDGGFGDSEWVGPIAFTTAFDCSTLGIPYAEDWSNQNLYFSCYTNEDSNADMLAWTFNTVNDLDGDGTEDTIVNIFPQAANVAKDDWLFTPAFSGVNNTEYTITVVYNSVDFNNVANESFDLVITDAASSTATNQTVIGSYSGITQSGVFGDTMGNDLITQAYTSTETYTPIADGDFHVGIHANTTALNSDVFFILSIEVTAALSVDEFDSDNFKYAYNKTTEQLTLESSNLPFDSIELYSILGQNVITRELSQTNETVNMSSLTDGVYLAKITINGNSKTVKVLKQ
ncbi:T9SS type A sorting domain-containing protein [Psychroserpens algicola]|uniref:T9SS type A sorting domain-containing protein n=1 Tax=Psychroserpens algicola TaxID=1719034 RepID=UPI0019546098|nr:T9SS type A sorting domain-containing protein [Psychroserpens algicola]